jgi:hypothetical protein
VLGRTLRWIGDQLPFLIVLAVLVVAVVDLLVDPDRWWIGAGIVAAAVLVAGLLRIVLPTSRAGMLAIRARWLDILMYVVLGVVILAVDIRLQG